jgi:hypothetical protein
MGLFLEKGTFLIFKALSSGPLVLVPGAGGLELAPPPFLIHRLGKPLLL